MKELKIGILGIQGDLEEHITSTQLALKAKGLIGRVGLVKKPEDVEEIDALIIGGGESTVSGRLSAVNGTLAALKKRIIDGMPVFGTCAGLVLLAKRAYDRVVGVTNQPLIGLLDVMVERNSFGRQRESFETDLTIPILGEKKFKGVFIRAPTIREIGPEVKEIARLGDTVVAAQQGSILVTAFHPELANDTRLHEYFLDLIIN